MSVVVVLVHFGELNVTRGHFHLVNVTLLLFTVYCIWIENPLRELLSGVSGVLRCIDVRSDA